MLMALLSFGPGAGGSPQVEAGPWVLPARPEQSQLAERWLPRGPEASGPGSPPPSSALRPCPLVKCTSLQPRPLPSVWGLGEGLVKWRKQLQGPLVCWHAGRPLRGWFGVSVVVA